MAVGVGEEGFREILGICEGGKEDETSWSEFLRHLKERGLKGVELVISDKCLGLLEAVGKFYPDPRWQRCIVHWYRNVFSVVPKAKVKQVAAILKAKRPSPWAGQGQQMTGLREASKNMRKILDSTRGLLAKDTGHDVRIADTTEKRTKKPLRRDRSTCEIRGRGIEG